MTDDAELLRRYANGRSEEAFAMLVQRHLPLVYHAALRRTNGDTHLAEDVAQAVFADLARSAGELQRHAMLAGWLYVATRHAAANAMRTETRRKIREYEAVIMNDAPAREVAESEWARLRPELDSVMDELAGSDRDAVLLRYFENRPYAEIGAILRLSDDAARRRVDRALEKLRTLLARRGITSTAAALSSLLTAQSAVAAPTGLAATVAGSALAGAGAAQASAGIIAFMTTNKIAWSVAGLVALVAGGSAVNQFRAARQAGDELATLRADQAKLQRHLKERQDEARRDAEKVRTAHARIAELEKKLDAANEKSAGDRKRGLQETKTTPANATAAGNQTNPWANPEYLQLQMKIAEKGIGIQYRPLYRRLGWPEEKIREFERLKLQQIQDTYDIMAAAGVAGVSLANPALNAQWDDPVVKQKVENLRTLVGEKDYPALVEYEDNRMYMARNPVETLVSNLHYTDSPLTFEQSARLTQLIFDNTSKPVQGAGAYTPPRTDWDPVYAQAAAFLAPEQLDTLRASNDRVQLLIESSALQKKLIEPVAAPSN
ncbi:MAG TPA: sigma-70 family RNA polymerase sigma factor [Lacunisphaera sp.]|nr:sigma-70 family RNA polymerase sigma factor [Lacunisphaera sp.]